MKHKFASEAELVRAYLSAIERESRDGDWVAYPETGAFDLLMVQKSSGVQVGIEAKLSLNVKVLIQALAGTKNWSHVGPDYRAVLVPGGGVQGGLHEISLRLGLTVLSPQDISWSGAPRWSIYNGLPEEADTHALEKWYPWCPVERVKLPDYVPDCIAGSPSPITLTQWKIKAIRAAILLDKQGYITRADIKDLGMDVSRWCNNSTWLQPAKRDGRFVQYTAGPGIPDFKAQHPRNYAEIEADYAVWFAELEKKRGKK